MPVILPGENWDPWLDPGLRDVEALRSMLIPAAPGVVVLHRVSDAVNNVRNNSAGLVVPMAAVPENTLLTEIAIQRLAAHLDLDRGFSLRNTCSLLWVRRAPL
jgi:hypothetical protein